MLTANIKRVVKDLYEQGIVFDLAMNEHSIRVKQMGRHSFVIINGQTGKHEHHPITDCYN